MVLTTLFQASVGHDDADIMLRTYKTLIGGAALYSDIVKWNPSQSEFVKHFITNFQRKSDRTSANGTRNQSMPGVI